MDYKPLQELLSAVGSVLSGIATCVAIYVAYKVHLNQKLLTQRQLILPLWDHMSTLTAIDPSAPIVEDVINVVNTLELVAICCEGGMIDENVILRTFREQFLKRYEEVERCRTLPLLNIDGRQLLRENRAAVTFYQKLDAARLTQDRINPA
jgi:hypothetical protein